MQFGGSWHAVRFERSPTYEESSVVFVLSRMSDDLRQFVSSSVKSTEIKIDSMRNCGNVSEHLFEFRHKIRSKAFVVLNHRKMPDVFHIGEPASRDKLGSGLGHCGCS